MHSNSLFIAPMRPPINVHRSNRWQPDEDEYLVAHIQQQRNAQQDAGRLQQDQVFKPDLQSISKEWLPVNPGRNMRNLYSRLYRRAVEQRSSDYVALNIHFQFASVHFRGKKQAARHEFLYRVMRVHNAAHAKRIAERIGGSTRAGWAGDTFRDPSV